jgi:hypothetical protein
MFARGLFRGFALRRILGLFGALLAAVGAILVLASSFAAGRGSVTAGAVLGGILGIVALVGAFGIYRGGKAILFPRIRLTGSGLLTIVIGIIMLALSLGTPAFLVLGGGVIALLATAV